ncbi:hypothetical protein PENTCL1PPCAC_29795, partial [Pristionchus entomophagus]
VYWIWGEDTGKGELIVAPFSDFSKRKVLHTPTAEMVKHNFHFHPKDRTLLTFSEYHHYINTVCFHHSDRKDVQYLKRFRPTGHLQILDKSQDMQTWLVTYQSAENPNDAIVYHRKLKSAEFLFDMKPDLKGYINTQIGFDFAARDGLMIQAYISFPPNVPLKNPDSVPEKDREFAAQKMIPQNQQKMVVLVHGGPESRDSFEYSSENGLLTSRGYAVMQVNFRGSSGFGKRLTNEGIGEWSRKMHTDLLDAVDFAVSKGIANKSAIAIMGGSYGGYATLVGLTFTPDTFVCGIDIVGLSNLTTLLDATVVDKELIKVEYVDLL